MYASSERPIAPSSSSSVLEVREAPEMIWSHTSFVLADVIDRVPLRDLLLVVVNPCRTMRSYYLPVVVVLPANLGITM